MAVSIHQIFYDDAQRPALDPSFIPYDNRSNPSPEWREYHVFRTEWLAGRCREGHITGFVSWKFGAKTGLRGSTFVRFIKRRPGYDAYFAHPFAVEPRPFANIWRQAEIHHPGILGLAQRIFDAVGMQVDLDSLEQPREQVLFCNYWAGTRSFWDRFMAFCEPVYQHILTGLDEADRRLIWSRADREIDAPYVPFIMERLFSTYLAMTPGIRAIGLDVARATRRPWYRRLLPRLGSGKRRATADFDPLAAVATDGDQPPPSVAAPGEPNHVRAIAMYLPQFHRVSENDAWWGEGFTEWTNVRRARSMFAGHLQPHVPHPDVGFYDLDDPSVLERQAAMARRYGIHGFCFYHYWFDGRRVLEKPVERLLASGQPDFPFCLCWANENWTRTWDGLDQEVLLQQRHTPESDARFLRELLPALRDRRYITVEGKPLVAVYRSGLLADPAATADRWRRIAEQEGLPGLYLATVHSFDQTDPRTIGFDAAIQYPPLQIQACALPRPRRFGLRRRFRGGLLDYREAVRQAISRPSTEYPLFRGVMSGWDNTPRRMERATVWVNESPELYGRWLRATADRMRGEQPPDRQFVFINAWNEWGEGAHLEPDTRRGYRLLEETAAALGLSKIADFPPT